MKHSKREEEKERSIKERQSEPEWERKSVKESQKQRLRQLKAERDNEW